MILISIARNQTSKASPSPEEREGVIEVGIFEPQQISLQ